MKQILVASDFSNSASNALTYALSLARVLKKEVVAINAIHPTEGINNNTYNAFFIETYYDKKREALKDWTNNIVQSGGFDDVIVKSICDVGFLRTVLERHAKNNAVALLVMGITGSTGILGIVGSNASMVIAKMRIPTLIIPLDSVFPPSPIITFATDYQSKLGSKDVKILNKIVKESEAAKIQILYIEETKEEETFIQKGEKKLKGILPNSDLLFNYIEDDDAADGIVDFVAKNETDILCLVKRQHNIIYRLFTSSTVNKVVNKGVKAILVLHE